MKKSFLIFLILIISGTLLSLYLIFRTIDLETAIQEYEDGDYINAIMILNGLIPNSDYETKEKIYYYRTKSINKLALDLETKFDDELKLVTLGNKNQKKFDKAKKEIDQKINTINREIKGDLSLLLLRKKSRIISTGQFYEEFISQYKGSSLVEDLDYEELVKLTDGDPGLLSKTLVAFYNKHPDTSYLSQLVKMIFRLLQDGNIILSTDDTTIMNIIINYGKQFPTSPEFNKIHQCQGDNVNLRNSPGLEGKPVGKIKQDEMVIQLEKSIDVQQIGDHRDYWYRITTLNGLRGWIFGKFLKPMDISKLTTTDKVEIWSFKDDFDEWSDSHTPKSWNHIDGAQKNTIVFTQANNNKILLLESINNKSGLFNRINTKLIFQVTIRARYLSGDSMVLYAYVLGNKKAYALTIKNEAVAISGRSIPIHTSDWHEYTLYSEDGKFAKLKIDGEIISSRILPTVDDDFNFQGIYCAYSPVTWNAKAEIDYLKIK